MAQYNVGDAKAHFSELVKKAMIGEEVLIAKDNKPVLKLVPIRAKKGTRKPGSGKGQILYMADDFDATPAEFKDYLP
jgi:prevent-host-death family protein